MMKRKKRTPRTRARQLDSSEDKQAPTEATAEQAGSDRLEPTGAVMVVLDNTIPAGFRMEPCQS